MIINHRKTVKPSFISMKDRIKRIIESQHMTQQEFAETIKIAPATLSSIFTGRTAPSLKIVEAIKSRFPDISTDWLMFGRGAMTDYKLPEAVSSFNPSSSPMVQSVSALDGVVGDITVAGKTVEVTGDSNLVSSKVESQSAGAKQHNTTIQGCRMTDDRTSTNSFKIVKNYDTNERKIAEIRIFYDDQTWETFVPKK